MSKHSHELNIPAHRAKDPPKTGALFFISIILQIYILPSEKTFFLWRVPHTSDEIEDTASEAPH
jgi:hypothetical protein